MHAAQHEDRDPAPGDPAAGRTRRAPGSAGAVPGSTGAASGSTGAAPGGGRTGAHGGGTRAEGSRSVFEPAEIGRALTRIAHEILERTSGAGDVILLGIPTRGVPLAHRLAGRMEQVEGHPFPAGSLDITMYRDDLRLRPARALGHTAVPAAGVDGQIVVLVDDVLYSGPPRPRSTRSATSAARASSSWRYSSTAGTGSFRYGPTTWARTCRPPSGRSSGCC
jgi:pyrimidine operon attenuation protein/uracil phosphoribosyltransferase